MIIIIDGSIQKCIWENLFLAADLVCVRIVCVHARVWMLFAV